MDRPAAPAHTTSSQGSLGARRLAVVALLILFVASGCSWTASSGALVAELAGGGLGAGRDGPLVASLGPVADAPGSLRGPIGGLFERLVDAAREVGADETTGGDPAAVAPGEDERAVRTIRLKPRPKPGAFSMNLYRKGDFLGQQTTYWCIPSSTQTMMNIMDDGPPNRSPRFQRRLYRIGDRLNEDGSIDRDEGPDRWRGMGISEWAGLLNRFGYGPYRIARAGTRQNAIRKAARAMRKTGKPVGLVVWRGAHAWVMSGFEATADPAHTNDFEVTHIYAQDPWYPRVSSIWGRSRPPNSRVSVRALAEDYVRYGRPGRYDPWRNDRFLLILPRLEPGTRVH
jgi:hypothetical protein